MAYDLLIDPFNTVFAVDCELQGDSLHCAALYVSPQVPFEFIRLAGNGAMIDVQLPESARNQGESLTALRVQLPLHHDEPLQRTVPA